VTLRSRLFWIAVMLLLLAICGERWRRSRLESSQDRNILAAAQKHRADPALIKAVIWRESRFNPKARGSKGETGLMQIMEVTGLEWAGAQRIPQFSQRTLWNAQHNIDCGTWYLQKALRRYQNTDDPVPYALADYNAGRSNVLRWMTGSARTNSAEFVRQIGFPSTRAYVQAVMQRRDKYRRDFPLERLTLNAPPRASSNR
jgi:soluble lytic murein transglycosylase